MRLPLPETLFGRLFAAIVAVGRGGAADPLSIVIVRERRELAFSRAAPALQRQASSRSASSSRACRIEQRRCTEQLRSSRPERYAPRHHRRPPRHENPPVLQRAFAREVQKELGARYAVSARPPRIVHDRGRSRSSLSATRPHAPPAGGRPRRSATRMFDLTVTLPDGDRVVFRTCSPRGTPPFPRHFISSSAC